jgi:hypothetical protein
MLGGRPIPMSADSTSQYHSTGSSRTTAIMRSHDDPLSQHSNTFSFQDGSPVVDTRSRCRDTFTGPCGGGKSQGGPRDLRSLSLLSLEVIGARSDDVVVADLPSRKMTPSLNSSV